MNNLPDERAPLFSLDRRKSTILRGIAILYVLLGHAGYIAWGGAGGVALFLLLSGYGLECSYEEKGLKDYWQKRIFKVWLPYCLIGVFNVLVLHETDAFRVFCSVTGLDLCRNVDKSMWYISYILLWYAAFYICTSLTEYIGEKRIRSAVKIGLIFLCSIAFWYLSRLMVWNGSSGAARYVIAFPLGVALSALGRLRVKEWIARLVWLGLFFLATVYMFISYGMTPWNWKYALFMALQVLAPSQLLQIRGAAERVLLWLGRYAYPIYLLEMTMLKRRETWWFAPLQYQPLIDLACLLVTALFAFAFWEAYRRFEELLTPALCKPKETEKPI